MFLVNVKKCQQIFDSVYVSSDSTDILFQAQEAGAIPILRGERLCGETPNIPVYQHALKYMPDDVKGIVAVQSNSPTIKKEIIEKVAKYIEAGAGEAMTCYEDGRIYGSVWAINKDKLLNYGDPYNPKPDFLVKDSSIDIHTLGDYNQALKEYNNIYEEIISNS